MRKKIKIAFLGVALCFTSIGAYAQKTLTGTVKDSNGEPLVGVVINVDGKSATITDLDGNYSISSAKSSSTISVSYVGYKSESKTVGQNSKLDFTLKPEDKTLDEVVVIGYGTMTYRLAVTRIKQLTMHR